MLLTEGEVEITTHVAETEIKWKIPNFWSLFAHDDLKSPDIHLGTVSWHLEMFKYDDGDYGVIYLFLCTDIVREYSVEYNFGLTRHDGS